MWFDEALPLFKAVKFDGETLGTKEYFEAALTCAKIYEYVWGGGMICRQLEKDLKGSAGPCLAAHLHSPEDFPNIASCPKDKIMGVEGFKKGLDVRDKMLWCTRALKFIVCILGKLVADAVLEVHVAAKATYNEVLAPHHSWPVRQVARTALSQCPWRRDMLKKLQLTNEEFISTAQELLGIMSPMVTYTHHTLVKFGLEKASATGGVLTAEEAAALKVAAAAAAKRTATVAEAAPAEGGAEAPAVPAVQEEEEAVPVPEEAAAAE